MRLLIYVARVYEKLIEKEAVYKTKLLKIPKPDFIVLYNGADPFPDEKTLRLSDAYHTLTAPYAALGGLLELEVRVLNINEGRNEAIIEKCSTLKDYVRFVESIRLYGKTEKDLKAAITKAVLDCIEKGILAEFLKSHASEVLNMLTTEWNLETAKKVWRQEWIEEGLEQGLSISAEIISALKKHLPAEEIAAQYNVPINQVKMLESLISPVSA